MTNKFEEAVQECVWPSFDDNGKFVTKEFDNVDALLKCVEENFGKRGLLFAKYEIYCIETNDHFSQSFDEWCASKKEHEHIFKLYNSISDIRTFYAQHLFNKKESV